MAPSAKAHHFPVQQRHPTPRNAEGLLRDRQSILWMTAIGAGTGMAYALMAAFVPFAGLSPVSSRSALAALIVCTSAAWLATYRGAVRAGVLLSVAGIWLSAALMLVAAGHDAPSPELFTVTVLFAALAAGRRVAGGVAGLSVVVTIVVWWFLPNGMDPAAGPLMLQRRPMLDFELLLCGSAISLWWSWHTERAAHAHAELAGTTQILETLREAVASSRAGIAIVDTHGVVTYANRALLDMWRFPSPGDAVGRGAFEFWADADAARVALLSLANGVDSLRTLRGKRADGSEFDVEISGSQVIGGDGQVDGYIGSFIDVTGRSLAESQLSVERERTRAIVESVLDIVVILDPSGTIVFENAAVERVLGFAPGERIGQSILAHAHPDDMARAGASMGELVTDPEKLVRVVSRFRHKDGSWRWLETFGRNLLHVPAIGGILGVGRDVTEHQEMQARLDAAERLETVGRLAGGIAHDFNNLLTAILGNAELAKVQPEAAGPVGRYLDGVMQAGERARDLTRKLLAFARREITQPVVIDLRTRLVDAEELLHRILGEDIALSVDTGPLPLTVLIDPVHFEQVILNLAVNARDAMPGGGTFTIRGELVQVHGVDPTFIGTLTPGTAVHLTVKDSGQGMPPEVAARVFEPFFTTKELGRGTGLGLSTAYGSVAQAGGAIRVTSTVGQGTTFEILLPMASGPAVSVAKTPVVSTPRQSAVVLVAEDDASVREFMVEVLETGGCRVLQADDGLSGSAMIDAHAAEIDLLVSDVVMPHRNGLELATYCRQARPGIPVLLVTGYSKDPTIEAQAEALGALVLLKPFSMEQLLSHVRRLLSPVGR